MLDTLCNAYNSAITFFKSPVPVRPLNVMPDHEFSLANKGDWEIINSKITAFNDALKASMVIDKEIQQKYLYAFGCWVGSYFIGPVALLGVFYFGDQKGEINKKHEEAVTTYRNALMELKVMLEWIKTGKESMQEKIHHPGILKLIHTLGPVLPAETIKIWEDKDLEEFKDHKFSFDEVDSLREFAKGSHKLTMTYLWYSEKATGYIGGAAKLAVEKPLGDAISTGMSLLKG